MFLPWQVLCLCPFPLLYFCTVHFWLFRSMFSNPNFWFNMFVCVLFQPIHGLPFTSAPAHLHSFMVVYRSCLFTVHFPALRSFWVVHLRSRPFASVLGWSRLFVFVFPPIYDSAPSWSFTSVSVHLHRAWLFRSVCVHFRVRVRFPAPSWSVQGKSIRCGDQYNGIKRNDTPTTRIPHHYSDYFGWNVIKISHSITKLSQNQWSMTNLAKLMMRDKKCFLLRNTLISLHNKFESNQTNRTIDTSKGNYHE